ncbi:MAG TPA: protein kinase [Haliangium sp.]|nr:protein kinase [Haliangium sp.]
MAPGRALGSDFAGTDRFRIVRQLGAGGVGVVYEAVDRARGTRVALKTLQRLDGEHILRFKKEFRLLQDLHHRNLVQLGELLEAEGRWFFTMELLLGVDFFAYVTGRPLPAAFSDSERILVPASISLGAVTEDASTATALTSSPSEDEGPDEGGAGSSAPRRQHVLDEARLREGLRQLATGLDALHRAGMIHRDIKPQNVMVCSGSSWAPATEVEADGTAPEHDRVVLLDFGMVGDTRAWDDEDRNAGGTPAYMAPEQAAGEAVMASDWYAVGVMLYQALTGIRPFDGHVAYVLMEKQRRDPVPPSMVEPGLHVPEDLEALCMRLLARAPAARPTGAEVLARLAGATSFVPASGAPEIGGASADPDPALIGREDEMRALHAAWMHAAPGRPVVALVQGVSGMGKTALVDSLARMLATEGGAGPSALVLRGRCYEREEVPYKAFDGVVDALSRFLKARASDTGALADTPDSEPRDSGAPNSAPGSSPEGAPKGSPGASASASPDTSLGVTVVDRPGQTPRSASGPGPGPGRAGIDAAVRGWMEHELPWLARLFPVLDRVLPGRMNEVGHGEVRDPLELRRRGFAALKSLLALLVAHRPVVLVVDDVQWGDRDSVALLADLLASPAPPGILFVATYRSEEASHPVVTALRHAVAVELPSSALRELEIGPLSEADCYALARMLGHHLTASGVAQKTARALDAIARSAAREAHGSPFFAGEMMRYLAAAGADARGMTLDGVIAARYRQLDAQARALLDVVALAGRPVAQVVALRAAGLDENARVPVNALRAGHFARTRGPAPEDAIEPYHDRIREAVVAGLRARGDEHVRAGYARLVAALEQSEDNDVEMRVLCHQGAGQTELAAQWALRAAEQAERALAFDRAAQMLRLALSLGAGGDAPALQARLADALAHAHRGTEAAAAYLDAASGVAPTQALVHTRQAAEQLLRSGSIDRGIELLGQVLTASGLTIPRSDARALLSLLWRRLRLLLRGLRYRPRAQTPADASRLADACWAGAVGLAVVDPIRSADFASRLLLMSLGLGDEIRIAGALAMEAGQRATAGNKSEVRVTALLRAVDDIAGRLDHPYVTGAAALARGSVATLNGRWRDAREHGERAERIFREHCTGVSWEIASARLFQFTGLYYLGNWRTLRERVLDVVRRAEERNDLYALTSVASFSAYSSLLVDDVAGARRAVERIQGKWRARGYHLQNYYQLLGHLQIDLYEGNGAQAWERLHRDLPRQGRVMVARVQLVRVVLTHTRARCALSLATQGQDRDGALLRVAEQAASRIERERLAWGDPMAAAVRAGIASCRGDDRAAVALLDRAIDGFDRADMGFFAAAARLRQAAIAGEQRGRDRLAEAEPVLRAEGVVNPDGLANMLIPGFARQV